MTLVGIGFRNVFRNKLRTALTVLGVAVSVIAFLFLRTIIASWTAEADNRSQSRIITRHKVSFVMYLPKKYADEVKAMPHVKQSSYGVWFGLRDPKREAEFFPSRADDDGVLDAYAPDLYVAPADKERWLHDRQGLAIGKLTAERMGWKVGDRITLLSRDWPNPADGWQFTVDAIYNSPTKGMDEKWVFAHYAYLNEFLPAPRQNQAQWVMAVLDSPGSANEVANQIDRHFETRELATVSQDEKTFSKGMLGAMSAVLAAANVVSIVILGVMALLVGNTIAMGVRERTTEYGVLRALGFGNGTVAVFIIAEAIVTMLLGGLVGLGIAYPLINFGIGPNIMREMGNFFAYFRVPNAAIGAAFGLTIVIGALAALLPMMRVLRIRTVDALRHVA